jgi:Terminase large subunit, T4likevirus-type, N-terminal
MTKLTADLQLALDPARLLRRWGFEPEEWQEDLLRSRPHRALLCCCRQAGKSSAAAASAVHEALYNPGGLSLMLAPAQRQSSELLRKARSLLTIVAPSVEFKADSMHTLELATGSRILSLPSREDTIRGYSNVALLIFDEAAWIDDDLYVATRPMLAVSGGRILALSTPNGQRGWFHREWTDGRDWSRTRITASNCPRISASFLAEERRTMSAAAYASEYDCEFTDAIDSVFFYAHIRAAIDPDLDPLYPRGW